MPENFYRHACVETPLYMRFEFGRHTIDGARGQQIDLVKTIVEGPVQFDCYCIGCEQEATFMRAYRTPNGYSSTFLGDKIQAFFVLMRCTRRSHQYVFLFRKVMDGDEATSIEKIGMLPSMEDIASSNLRKYRDLISREDFSELHRAGGLASHAIGIGSFVYLRRIFEKQIRTHYDRLVAERGPIEGFEVMRVEDKIQAISDYLPIALVQHRKIYGILSKGIHELDEKTCLSFFKPLRQAIILILEQDYQMRERERADEELKKSLGGIMQSIQKE